MWKTHRRGLCSIQIDSICEKRDSIEKNPFRIGITCDDVVCCGSKWPVVALRTSRVCICLNRSERVCVRVRLSLFLVAISFITHRLFIVCVLCVAGVCACVCVRMYHLFSPLANHSNAKQLSDCEGTFAQMLLYLFILSPNANTFIFGFIDTYSFWFELFKSCVWDVVMWMSEHHHHHGHFDKRTNGKKVPYRTIDISMYKLIIK